MNIFSSIKTMLCNILSFIKLDKVIKSNEKYCKIEMSADGTKIVVYNYNGKNYYSNDSGKSFILLTNLRKK